MTAFWDQITADFTRTLNEFGQSVVIDGIEVQVFIGQVEDVPGETEQLFMSRQKVSHLDGALPLKVPMQSIDIDGLEWTVISHRTGKFSVCLAVERILA